MSLSKESPFLMEWSEKFGRYLVAKVDLPAGQMIFKEHPLFVYSRYRDTLRDEMKFPCITCFRVVEMTSAVSCYICDWKFCSKACAKIHRGWECMALSVNEVEQTPKAIRSVYLIRLMVMKKKDRPRWKQIMNLASTLDSGNAEYEEYLSRVAFEGNTFLRKSCKRNFSHEEIEEIVTILKVNSFSFTGKNNKDGRKYSAVYGTCSLMAHSCAPNVEWLPQEEGNATGIIGIYTRKAIAAGEMVTYAYTGERMLEGTLERRTFLYKSFSFWCNCDRCLDPTELGTSYSNVKCPRCANGSLVPPQCESRVKRFKCNQCSFSPSPHIVKTIEGNFQRKLLALKNKSAQYQQRILDDLISNANSHYQLHSHHSLVIKAIRSWIPLQSLVDLMYSSRESQVIYTKLVDRLERILTISHSFGTIAERVKWTSLMVAVLIRFNFKSFDYIAIRCDIRDLNKKMSIIWKIVKHLRRGIQFSDHSILDSETSALVDDMEKAYIIWNSRLSKCEIDMRSS